MRDEETLPAAALRAALHAEGWRVDDVAPLDGGLGGAALWRVVLADGRAGVARVFPPGAADAARREGEAMIAARRGGASVPEVHAALTVDRHPVLLMDLVPGQTAMQTLEAAPGDGYPLGRSLGEALAQLHRVVAPGGLLSESVTPQAGAHPNTAWIDLGGEALRPLHPHLRALPRQDRLLHLDYHPLNALVEGGEVTGIIDWANARPGPPHLDLARSVAIVDAARAAGVLPAPVSGADPLDDFLRGLVDGHAATFGPDPHPALSRAWALAMTVADVQGHIGRSGSPFTASVVEALSAVRDEAITAAI